MALGCEMRDDIGLEVADRSLDCISIADIALNKAVSIAVGNPFDRCQGAGVCQLIKIENFVFRIFDKVAD